MCVEPSIPSNAPVVRPNYINYRRKMGEHVGTSAGAEVDPGAGVGVENSGMDVDMVDGEMKLFVSKLFVSPSGPIVKLLKRGVLAARL